MFKAEPVDQYGNLIDRHNLWEMVGVRYRRSLFPGFSDAAEYAFRCSGSATPSDPALREQSFELRAPEGPAEIRVEARLLYRKIDQYLLNFMFGEQAGLTSPVTEMARAEGRLRVVSPGDRAVAEASTTPVPVRVAALP
jgi:hypothetical protein